jgi:class 3 adenylate cyclase
MVGTIRSLRERGWAVAVRRPEDEAFSALAAARRASLLAAALAALFGVSLGAWLAARTTRPVRALVELTRAYARREFAARSPVKTGDELEALGASMAEMADRLGASEAEIARRAAAEADIARYVPPAVARAVASGAVSLRLGGQRRVISALFADLVGFTSFAEASPPERVAAFLNELFTVMTEVVFRHEGSVDKLMGDSMLALFGAVSDQPDHAERALAAAEDLHRFVEASAPAWQQKYSFEVRLAIGIDSGEAVVGNLGSELRMDYTAVGEVVNIASQLERLAKPGQTLCTAAVARAAQQSFTLARLGAHPIDGKRRSVELYELR